MLILQRFKYALSPVYPDRCRISQWRRSISQLSHLGESLPLRPRNLIYDNLSPTNSRLLDVTLAEVFQEDSTSYDDLPNSPVSSAHPELPQGHHLVYFSTQVPDSALLPDGTDTLQYPGQPLVRRLWAGGRLEFQSSLQGGFRLDGRKAACEESIKNAVVKGLDGRDSVLVSIERRYGYFKAYLDGLRKDGNASDRREQETTVAPQEEYKNDAAIVETRDLVFLRAKSREEARADAVKPQRILRSLGTPDFSASFIPTRSMLFRFSALTFNAHLIHLDPTYAREVEGYRNLVVHGPLTLVLMLSVLSKRLHPGFFVREFSYRNLAPLYAEEALRVCIRQNEAKEKFDVWIEGKDGSLAVRASAFIGAESP